MKRFKLLLASCLLTLSMGMTAYAGQWLEDDTGWWYQNSDNSYVKSGWYWIDGKSYFFSDSGYILTNTKTPDGYDVNASGAWVVNGQEQVRSTEISTKSFTVTVPNGYDVKIDAEDDSILLQETNDSFCVFLMAVHEEAIQYIRDNYGDEGLQELKDEAVDGIINTFGQDPVILNHDVKQYNSGVWDHYIYVVNVDAETIMPCNIYISVVGNDVKIVFILGENREFTEDQFMMNYLK